MQLTTSVTYLPAVDVPTARGLLQMQLRCVADLILHLPTRYERFRPGRTIEALAALMDTGTLPAEHVELHGELVSVRPGFRRRTPTEAVLDDGTGTITLTFFNQPWMARKLQAGATVLASGLPKVHRGSLQLTNPKIRSARDAALVMPDGDDTVQLTPVYPASEAVPSRTIAAVIDAILDEATSLLDDHLTDEHRHANNLMLLSDAWRTMHRPSHEEDVPPARRRLAYDELLLLQLGVAMRRDLRDRTLKAPPLQVNEAIVSRIEQRLPFTLTRAQDRVLGEIADDLSKARPMNRLLQGDVGSGKTAVAAGAMLLAVADGAQAVLVAPTELLAEQHMSTLRTMLDDSRVRFELLTGSVKTSTRRVLLERLIEGDIDILVGTHALLSQGVQFKNLALAVIDEQHRFGVQQRSELGTKGDSAVHRPHQLVMTATPIPRTLSVKWFGDLDVSVIDERPPGRKPIRTRHVSARDADAVYGHLAERAASGAQAWIVVPVIDESERGLTDLNSHLERLAEGPLRGLRLAAMHGRLPADERDAVMSRFHAGELDALVCTTVIEVGVDVPNAGMIVIENAAQFGLAQLHQLRGRVGRGDVQGECVLIADPTTEDGTARINAMLDTDDGFRIAEHDLAIRGVGELFGTRQSGMPPFRVADLQRDMALLQLARTHADAMVAADPDLAAPESVLLRRRLLKAHGRWMGLGDVV